MIDDLDLSPHQREKLEQELLSAFDKSGLEVLARRLGIKLAEIAEGALRQVVTQLLDQAERLGQRMRLVRMARSLNSSHPGLNKLIATLLPRKFRGEQINELVQILHEGNVSWGILKQHFWQCLPKIWSDPLTKEFQNEADQIQESVEVLSEYAEQGSSGQMPPLFDFVLRLHKSLGAGPVADRLLKWTEHTALVLGKDPEALKNYGYKLLEELWLLVKIERVTSEKFRVEGWLADSLTTRPRLIFQEDHQSWLLSEIPGVLKRLWRQPSLLEPLKQLGESKLTVEFLLPSELIAYPVESWNVLPGAPIGARYKVVVRSLERAYAEVRPPLELALEDLPIAAVAWNDKWRVLLNAPTKHPMLLWICEAADHSGSRFLAKLAHPQIVCMALTLTPPMLSDLTLRELLQHGLLNGMPIALWIRKPQCSSAEVETLFKSLLADLSKLPSQTLQSRWEGLDSGDEGHLGNHLTLLWDDPNRLPADARAGSDYSAPITTGIK